MKPIPRPTVRLLALVTVLAAGPLLTAAVRPAHLQLAKSTPADGSTITAVSEIRLWFTAPPMAMGPNTVELRILDGAGKTLTTGSGVKDSKDDKVYSLALPRGLRAGAYALAWQTMALDGDVVKGQFRFTVAAE
jgi:methionine-rich copper-binding protein CopC